jgi:large subunit ribosomal protein L21
VRLSREEGKVDLGLFGLLGRQLLGRPNPSKIRAVCATGPGLGPRTGMTYACRSAHGVRLVSVRLVARSHENLARQESAAMYAIVKTGGKQYRVAEGDVIEVEKLVGAPGDAVTLSAVLLVDGDTLVTEASKLADVAVTGEVVEHTKGPKIRIHKFKNKTGYHKRQGHRQPLTRVKVTGISSGK